jgi:hypothetical protein
MIEQLKQLITATWDGNLMSKQYRDDLVKSGLAQRAFGYNWITEKGLEYLVNLRLLVPM